MHEMKRNNMSEFLMGLSGVSGTIGLVLFGYVFGQSLNPELAIHMGDHALFMPAMICLAISVGMLLIAAFDRPEISEQG